jgi:hypothetical protein
VIAGPMMRLRWDDLDAQGCADDGAPDWNSTIVVGPTKVRDARGNVSLQWTVTVQCQRAGQGGVIAPPRITAPTADTEPAPLPEVGTAA